LRDNPCVSYKLTTSGDESFSQNLIVVVKGSQSFYYSPADFQPTIEKLRVIRDNKRKISKLSKPAAKPSIDISWFDLAMQPARGPLKPVDIIPVIAGLTSLLKECYFDEVNFLLKSFKVKDAAPEMMVALLRTTFLLKGKYLPYWSKFLRQVRDELTSRKLDSEAILRGLV